MGGGSSTPAPQPISSVYSNVNGNLRTDDYYYAYDSNIYDSSGSMAQAVVKLHTLLLSSGSGGMLGLKFEMNDLGASDGGNNLSCSFSVYLNGNTVAYRTDSFGGDYESVEWSIPFYAGNITSIRVVASVSGSTYIALGGLRTGTATARIDVTFPISRVIAPMCFISSPAQVLLPQNPTTGQQVFLKMCRDGTTGIHGGSIKVENGFYSSTLSGTTDYGFLMTSNDACTLIYDGATWCIMNYFDGVNYFTGNYVRGYINWATPSTIGTQVLITSSVTLCDISTSDKFLNLPNPAGSLRLLYIIARNGGGSNNRVRVYPNSYGLENNPVGYDHVYIYPDASSKNATLCLISDGSKWWVLNMFDGHGVLFDTTVETRRAINTNKTFNVLSPSSGDIDGFTLPSVSITGTMYHLKMRKDSPYDKSIVLDNGTDPTTISVGDGAARCFIPANRDFSAVSVIGVKDGALSKWYIAGFYGGH